MKTRPAVVIAVALALGIAAADWLRPHPAVILALLMLLLAVGLARKKGGGLLLVALLLFGALRYAYVQTAGRGSLAAWEGQKVRLVGTVVGEPEVRQGGGVAYIVAVEKVDGQPTAGRLYVTQRGGAAPVFGERVEAWGRLDRPIGPRIPGGFDQAAYLARQSVYLVLDTGAVQRLGPGRLDPLRRAAVWTRLRLEEVLRRALPAPEAALMAGLLFGSRSELPDDIKEAFRAAGVFHLLAVSGGNVAMLVMPLLWLLRRAGLGQRTASALAIPIVLFFVFLTGASPSVLRAGLMAILVLLGDVLRRERDGLNTLGAAVAILLALTPTLLFDLGFQLSVGATLGILLFARPVERWLAQRLERLLPAWISGQLAGGLSVTFAAQALVEPLSLHNFGTFSAVAPLANLVVLLFVAWLVPFGLVAVLAGALLGPAVWLLGFVGSISLPLLIYAVKAMATLPLAYVEVGRLPLIWVLVWYGVLVLATLPAARSRVGEALSAARRAVSVGWWAPAATLLAVVVATLAWRYALAAPPDELKVIFLDVGQGDATLIQAPGGRSVLIDAGQAYPADPARGRPGFDAGERVVAPYLAHAGVRRLDYLVLTHPDSDHVGGGAAVLRAVPTVAVVVSDPGAPEPSQVATLAVAQQRGVRLARVTEGEQISLGGGVVLEVLGPPDRPFSGTRSDDNANCIALRVRYRQVAILLACDLEAVAEERLVEAGYDLRADLLKVSHHGSGFSSTPAFLQAVSPRYAVVSAGNGNPFGHPAPAALARLDQAGAQVWRTDRHGTITVRTDGFRLRIAAVRARPEDDAYRPLGLLGRRLFRAW